jgi:hypothetical protein
LHLLRQRSLCRLSLFTELHAAVGKNRVVSETTLFETRPSFLLFPEQQGCRFVSKLVLKSKFHNLTTQ